MADTTKALMIELKLETSELDKGYDAIAEALKQAQTDINRTQIELSKSVQASLAEISKVTTDLAEKPAKAFNDYVEAIETRMAAHKDFLNDFYKKIGEVTPTDLTLPTIDPKEANKLKDTLTESYVKEFDKVDKKLEESEGAFAKHLESKKSGLDNDVKTKEEHSAAIKALYANDLDAEAEYFDSLRRGLETAQAEIAEVDMIVNVVSGSMMGDPISQKQLAADIDDINKSVQQLLQVTTSTSAKTAQADELDDIEDILDEIEGNTEGQGNLMKLMMFIVRLRRRRAMAKMQLRQAEKLDDIEDANIEGSTENITVTEETSEELKSKIDETKKAITDSGEAQQKAIAESAADDRIINIASRMVDILRNIGAIGEDQLKQLKAPKPIQIEGKKEVDVPKEKVQKLDRQLNEAKKDASEARAATEEARQEQDEFRRKAIHVEVEKVEDIRKEAEANEVVREKKAAKARGRFADAIQAFFDNRKLKKLGLDKLGADVKKEDRKSAIRRERDEKIARRRIRELKAAGLEAEEDPAVKRYRQRLAEEEKYNKSTKGKMERMLAERKAAREERKKERILGTKGDDPKLKKFNSSIDIFKEAVVDNAKAMAAGIAEMFKSRPGAKPVRRETEEQRDVRIGKEEEEKLKKRRERKALIAEGVAVGEDPDVIAERARLREIEALELERIRVEGAKEERKLRREARKEARKEFRQLNRQRKDSEEEILDVRLKGMKDAAKEDKEGVRVVEADVIKTNHELNEKAIKQEHDDRMRSIAAQRKSLMEEHDQELKNIENRKTKYNEIVENRRKKLIQAIVDEDRNFEKQMKERAELETKTRKEAIEGPALTEAIENAEKAALAQVRSLHKDDAKTRIKLEASIVDERRKLNELFYDQGRGAEEEIRQRREKRLKMDHELQVGVLRRRYEEEFGLQHKKNKLDIGNHDRIILNSTLERRKKLQSLDQQQQMLEAQAKQEEENAKARVSGFEDARKEFEKKFGDKDKIIIDIDFENMEEAKEDVEEVTEKKVVPVEVEFAGDTEEEIQEKIERLGPIAAEAEIAIDTDEVEKKLDDVGEDVEIEVEVDDESIEDLGDTVDDTKDSIEELKETAEEDTEAFEPEAERIEELDEKVKDVHGKVEDFLKTTDDKPGKLFDRAKKETEELTEEAKKAQKEVEDLKKETEKKGKKGFLGGFVKRIKGLFKSNRRAQRSTEDLGDATEDASGAQDDMTQSSGKLMDKLKALGKKGGIIGAVVTGLIGLAGAAQGAFAAFTREADELSYSAERSAKSLGLNSKETKKLKDELVNIQKPAEMSGEDLARVADEMGRATGVAKESVGELTADVVKLSERMGEVDATDLATGINSLSSEVGDANQAIALTNELSKELSVTQKEDLGGSLEDLSETIGTANEALGDNQKATKEAAEVTALFAKSSTDMGEAIDSTNTVFEEMNNTIKDPDAISTLQTALPTGMSLTSIGMKEGSASATDLIKSFSGASEESRQFRENLKQLAEDSESGISEDFIKALEKADDSLQKSGINVDSFGKKFDNLGEKVKDWGEDATKTYERAEKKLVVAQTKLATAVSESWVGDMARSVGEGLADAALSVTNWFLDLFESAETVAMDIEAEFDRIKDVSKVVSGAADEVSMHMEKMAASGEVSQARLDAAFDAVKGSMSEIEEISPSVARNIKEILEQEGTKTIEQLQQIEELMALAEERGKRQEYIKAAELAEGAREALAEAADDLASETNEYLAKISVEALDNLSSSAFAEMRERVAELHKETGVAFDDYNENQENALHNAEQLQKVYRNTITVLDEMKQEASEAGDIELYGDLDAQLREIEEVQSKLEADVSKMYEGIETNVQRLLKAEVARLEKNNEVVDLAKLQEKVWKDVAHAYSDGDEVLHGQMEKLDEIFQKQFAINTNSMRNAQEEEVRLNKLRDIKTDLTVKDEETMNAAKEKLRLLIEESGFNERMTGVKDAHLKQDLETLGLGKEFNQMFRERQDARLLELETMKEAGHALSEQEEKELQVLNSVVATIKAREAEQDYLSRAAEFAIKRENLERAIEDTIKEQIEGQEDSNEARLAAIKALRKQNQEELKILQTNKVTSAEEAARVVHLGRMEAILVQQEVALKSQDAAYGLLTTSNEYILDLLEQELDTQHRQGKTREQLNGLDIEALENIKERLVAERNELKLMLANVKAMTTENKTAVQRNKLLVEAQQMLDSYNEKLGIAPTGVKKQTITIENMMKELEGAIGEADKNIANVSARIAHLRARAGKVEDKKGAAKREKAEKKQDKLDKDRMKEQEALLKAQEEARKKAEEYAKKMAEINQKYLDRIAEIEKEIRDKLHQKELEEIRQRFELIKSMRAEAKERENLKDRLFEFARSIQKNILGLINRSISNIESIIENYLTPSEKLVRNLSALAIKESDEYKTTKEKIAAGKAEIEVLNQQIEDFQSKVGIAQGDYKTAKANFEALQGDLVTLKKQIAAANAEKEAAELRLNEAKERQNKQKEKAADERAAAAEKRVKQRGEELGISGLAGAEFAVPLDVALTKFRKGFAHIDKLLDKSGKTWVKTMTASKKYITTEQDAIAELAGVFKGTTEVVGGTGEMKIGGVKVSFATPTQETKAWMGIIEQLEKEVANLGSTSSESFGSAVEDITDYRNASTLAGSSVAKLLQNKEDLVRAIDKAEESTKGYKGELDEQNSVLNNYIKTLTETRENLLLLEGEMDAMLKINIRPLEKAASGLHNINERLKQQAEAYESARDLAIAGNREEAVKQFNEATKIITASDKMLVEQLTNTVRAGGKIENILVKLGEHIVGLREKYKEAAKATERQKILGDIEKYTKQEDKIRKLLQFIRDISKQSAELTKLSEEAFDIDTFQKNYDQILKLQQDRVNVSEKILTLEDKLKELTIDQVDEKAILEKSLNDQKKEYVKIGNKIKDIMDALGEEGKIRLLADVSKEIADNYADVENTVSTINSTFEQMNNWGKDNLTLAKEQAREQRKALTDQIERLKLQFKIDTEQRGKITEQRLEQLYADEEITEEQYQQILKLQEALDLYEEITPVLLEIEDIKKRTAKHQERMGELEKQHAREQKKNFGGRFRDIIRAQKLADAQQKANLDRLKEIREEREQINKLTEEQRKKAMASPEYKAMLEEEKDTLAEVEGHAKTRAQTYVNLVKEAVGMAENLTDMLEGVADMVRNWEFMGEGEKVTAVGDQLTKIGNALLNSGNQVLMTAGAILLGTGAILKVYQRIKNLIEGEKKSALEAAREKIAKEKALLDIYNAQIKALKEQIEINDKRYDQESEQMEFIEKEHEKWINNLDEHLQAILRGHDSALIARRAHYEQLVAQETARLEGLDERDDINREDAEKNIALYQNYIDQLTTEIDYRKEINDLLEKQAQTQQTLIDLSTKYATDLKDYHQVFRNLTISIDRQMKQLEADLMDIVYVEGWGTGVTKDMMDEMMEVLASGDVDAIKRYFKNFWAGLSPESAFFSDELAQLIDSIIGNLEERNRLDDHYEQTLQDEVNRLKQILDFERERLAHLRDIGKITEDTFMWLDSLAIEKKYQAAWDDLQKLFDNIGISMADVIDESGNINISILRILLETEEGYEDIITAVKELLAVETDRHSVIMAGYDLQRKRMDHEEKRIEYMHKTSQITEEQYHRQRKQRLDYRLQVEKNILREMEEQGIVGDMLTAQLELIWDLEVAILDLKQEQNKEDDIALNNMVKRRQEAIRLARASGDYALVASIDQEVREHLKQKGWEPEKIESFMESLPKFHAGGYHQNDELFMSKKGEFTVRPEIVDLLGREFFEKLNRGMMVNPFAIENTREGKALTNMITNYFNDTYNININNEQNVTINGATEPTRVAEALDLETKNRFFDMINEGLRQRKVNTKIGGE